MQPASDTTSTLGWSTGFHAHYALSDTLLGAGEYGKVWLAEHRYTKQQVAVKIIAKHRDDRSLAQHLHCIQAEVDIWSRCQTSDYVTRLEGLYEDAGSVYLVQELCSGGDLRSVLKRNLLTEAEAAQAMRAVLDVLHECHSQQVLYGDVKPANFLLRHPHKSVDCLRFPDAPTLDVEAAPAEQPPGAGTSERAHSPAPSAAQAAAVAAAPAPAGGAGAAATGGRAGGTQAQPRSVRTRYIAPSLSPQPPGGPDTCPALLNGGSIISGSGICPPGIGRVSVSPDSSSVGPGSSSVSPGSSVGSGASGSANGSTGERGSGTLQAVIAGAQWFRVAAGAAGSGPGDKCGPSCPTDIEVLATDFGCAQRLHSRSRCAAAAVKRMGSPVYMAPEQWQGGSLGVASDIWAAGIMLYQLLSGRFPFWPDLPADKVEGQAAGLALYQVVMAIQSNPVHVKGQPWSRECKDLLCRMLDRQPGSRITAYEALQHPWFRQQLGYTPQTARQPLQAEPARDGDEQRAAHGPALMALPAVRCIPSALRDQPDLAPPHSAQPS